MTSVTLNRYQDRDPTRSNRAARGGFSFIEVMISVIILATALITMMGSIYSLNTAHQREREDAIVQQLANTMVERVMGANFATLGQSVLPSVSLDQNAWSWQRRATLLPANVAIEFQQTSDPMNITALTQPVNPPLMENVDPAAPYYATSDLIKQGLEPSLSGLTGLRVYVEYYNMNILLNQQALTQQASSPPASLNPIAWARQSWVSMVGDPTLTDPTTSPPTFPAASTATFVPLTVGPAPATLATPLNIFQPEYSGVTPIVSSTNDPLHPTLPALAPVQINLVAVTNANALADVQAAMNQNSATLVRVLVFWVSWRGDKRWHEVTVIRRGDS
jgi:hypothetical protein